MATMVKEKRREKKKCKEKSPRSTHSAMTEETSRNDALTLPEHPSSSQTTVIVELETRAKSSDETENVVQHLSTVGDSQEATESPELTENQSVHKQSSEVHKNEPNQNPNTPKSLEIDTHITWKSKEGSASNVAYLEVNKTETVPVMFVKNVTDNYEFLNSRLANIAIPDTTETISEARELDLSDSDAYLKSFCQIIPESENMLSQELLNVDVLPSAPMCEEVIEPQVRNQHEIVKVTKPSLQCMPLEKAVSIFGGAEMTAVKMMSAQEEAIVEAGPVSGPEHPLVDLLSTFKSSLNAVENERSKLACGFAIEEKFRSALWKIDKRNIYQKKECKCGTSVELKAVYEHAELLKDRMPVARLRLESLLRDVQDSYCHYQHAALLAHCQIEELIAETTLSNKKEIREAMSLILQTLRVTDGTATVLSAALRRWAAALAAALVDDRDPRQLLFVLHHLFRQSRSVRWAARVLQTRVPDRVAAARALALLDTLLANPRLDTALECTEEEYEDAWEEVSARGTGGAVSSGALREIDLIALLRVFPLRDLVARILMFTHADIRTCREYEWGDASGGRGVLTASCGVRALLSVLHRTVLAHPLYSRLYKNMRIIAASALEALSCFYQCPRAPYDKDVEEKIAGEFQACFTEAFTLFGTQNLHILTTALLTDDMSKEYCLAFIVGLHDKSPKKIESLSIDTPVLPCEVRVRIVTYAAVHRKQDHELARIVLDFLFQTGAKTKSMSCKAGCVSAARECLSLLIAAHPYLHTVALHIVANLTQVESLDPSVIKLLHVDKWRPQSGEMRAVLEDWEHRCPQLLQQLLLLLDYTPFTGISLPVQLYIGSWACSRASRHPSSAEHCWRVLLRLRTHRVCWGTGEDVPAPDVEPRDVMSSAYAVLASSWGHSIPLICSVGVSALCSLTARPREAVHCLAPVMLLMASSPESISLTPKFTEFFTSILNSGPTLVQRALGRGAVPGSELLLRLVLAQVEGEQCGGRSVLSAWLHALWRVAHPAATAVLDTAALAAREWTALDTHAATLLQEKNAKEYVTNAVQNASTAPLLCECLLRAYHTHREVNTRMFGAVANILWEQRVNGQRIHVDNALQKIKASTSSEELVIYQSALAAMSAPLHHPSHLTLWRLFLHIYLQRPPNNMRETALPVGPLFFSGLIKSRMLSQIKKRLQDTATYHHNEAETYKTNNRRESIQNTNRVVKSESITIEKGLLPALTIEDLTGESSVSDSESDDDSDESEGDSKIEEKQVDDDKSEMEKKHIFNMACYHTGAERMVREFSQWLEEDDRVRATPHHADIARFIPEQAIEEAWKTALSHSRPPPSPELDEFPRPARPPASPPERQLTPLDSAVNSIMKIKDRSRIRSRRLIKSPLEDIDFKDTRTLLSIVDKHLKDVDQLAKDWCTEVSRISSLDKHLWELVTALRVPRPLPPVTKRCTNTKLKCKPIVFYIDEREWCISTGAERGIKDNRSSSHSAIRRLARARPHAARTAAALHSIARRIGESGAAMCVLERAWHGAASCVQCGAAHAALTALLDEIAQRWICHDGRLVADLISRWCSKNTNTLQQALCGSLISPRRINMTEWPLVYAALLRAKLPSHTIFSFLSKFEMSHWSLSAEQSYRRELMDALLAAQTRHGPVPDTEHAMLLELTGVHTTALINEHELCATVMKYARVSVEGRLPPLQWTHVIKAAEIVGSGVSFDQLGHLLRDIGVLWWEARTTYKGAPTLVPYAPHVAKLLRTLLRNFIAAAVKLSYEPERVGRCTWSAVQESWGAWVAPHPAALPLLPSLASKEGHYTTMLQCLVDCLKELMSDCPGSEISILQHVFEWATVSHMSSQTANAHQESRVQGSELLARLGALPWDSHQWFYGTSLQLAMQICATNDREIMSWCSDTWRATRAVTMLLDVTDETLEPRLALLLYLFTGTQLRHEQHILEEATLLPWWRLPEPALAEALDRFFAVHHSPLQAYHDLPQFQVILFASELRVLGAQRQSGQCSHSAQKRARALSQWTVSCAAPALHAHMRTHTQSLLHTLADLVQYLAVGEIEELLCRASVIMCMEPAAATALPVWREWISHTPRDLTLSCVTAACALTAAEYCAELADTAVRTYLQHNDSGWSELVERWSRASPWREPQVFASRASLHAAYVCALANAHHDHARPLLAALHTADINFIENEVIVAVWICYLCRVALTCAARGATRSESAESARALLLAWAHPPRRSILRVVTLQPDTDRTTAHQRLLCRLAECILSPSAEAVQAYESCCVSAPGNNGDVMSWGRSAKYLHLPRLALRLYPKHDKYFQRELDAAAETTQ